MDTRKSGGMPAHQQDIEMDDPKKAVQFQSRVPQQVTIIDDPIDVDHLMSGEIKGDAVFETKPYFSHSILQTTMAVYIVWCLVYFAYRVYATLNHYSYATLIFSIIMVIVEFLGFLGTSLHFNNFTNPQTNILLQKLPDILERQKKDYPPVASFICCYKEPQHIVSRTINAAMSIDYPPEKHLVALLDDSANFREQRGWVHVQSIEKNFLYHLLYRCVRRVWAGKPPQLSEDEDVRGVLGPALDRISETTKAAIDAEIHWFLEYLVLNSWQQASDIKDRNDDDYENERMLIAELRQDEFNPYRTFTEDDLEMINRFSVEGLQLMWHGSAFFRPIVRCALFQRPGIRAYVQRLCDSGELQYITPAAIALAKYRVLLLGRDELPMHEVSAGNVRVDFESVGTIPSPRGVYIRRRKPKNPHNKAGNINNALFNESTSTDFEFVSLLDADQQPHADYLKRTLPYFFSSDGHNVAWVQTPQFFSNIFPLDDPLGHRNMEFYGPVGEGRGAFGACPFVGTNAIFCRAHLCEVGGIMYNSVTEDMYTGMKLHAAGYKSLYHNEVLAIGSAPVDLKETLEQRKRWAQGAVEIFSLTPWGHLASKIGWRKTLMYLDSCLYPFLAFTAFWYAVTPLIMAIWTVPIVVNDPVLFVLVGYVPVMILPRVINYMLLRAQRPYEEGRSAPALWIEATDIWRAEQTFFSFAGTYISAWNAGRTGIKNTRAKYGVKGSLAMWNWNRDFLKPKPGDANKPAAKKVNEQTFRSSNKETDQIKNTRLFATNLIMFGINVLAVIFSCLAFNCDASRIWIFVVVVGFAISNMWHLWSFIPMALRQNESQWPYASSYHAHNLLLFCILGFLVFLYVKIRACVYQELAIHDKTVITPGDSWLRGG